MELKPREIALMGLTVSMIIVFGLIIYSLSLMLPIPGSKFLLLAPFLSFMYTVPILRIDKRGVIFVLSILFALMMSFITILMGIAIASAGTAAEATSLLFRGLKKRNSAVYSAALMPFYGFISFLILNQFVLKVEILNQLPTAFLASALVYALGIIGGKAALFINEKI